MMSPFRKIIFGLLFMFSFVASADYSFVTQSGKHGTIELIENEKGIDMNSSKKVLVESFIHEYRQYLAPQEVDSKLKVWLKTDGKASVEQYYDNYFEEEFAEFIKGGLFWIQAKVNNQVAGWATFREEEKEANSLYMNLLIVSPGFQKQGIGKELTYSLIRLGKFPNTKKINLLLRKKNQGGRMFYSKLGFLPNPSYQRENFVDLSLLEGWTLNLSKE